MPKATKPKTIKRLSSHVNSLFAKTLTEDEVSRLVQALKDSGVISITDNKVAYHG